MGDRVTTMAAMGVLVAWVVHFGPGLIPSSIDLWPSTPSRTNTMRAVAYAKGAPLELHESYPRPRLQPHQVLIEVKHSAINPCDFKFQRNHIVPNFVLPKPKIPGADIAGVVVQVGSEVTSDDLQVGDRVAAMMPLLGARWGALAEYAVVDATFVAHVGPKTSLAHAAVMPLVSLTALQGLEKLTTTNLPIQSILVHAGAGGLGSVAIQYAKHVLKVETVVTTASSEKTDLLKKLGADVVIDYRTDKFENIISNVDVVFDPMSWNYESRSLGILKKKGHYLNVLSSDWALNGSVEQTNGIRSFSRWFHHSFWNLIRRGLMPQYDFVTVNPNGEQLQQILDLVENGTIRPVIDRTFDLKDAAEAYDYLQQSHATGKVIINHSDDEIEKKQEGDEKSAEA